MTDDVCKTPDDLWGKERPRDTTIQIILSVALGLVTFAAFCILRPRWKGLYAARKKYNGQATSLPELPDSLFGWVWPLWKISEEQVLASAGLDAYVFLAFFKMAIKFLLVTLFFALVIIKPVHDRFPDNEKAVHHDSSQVFEDPGFTEYRYNTNYIMHPVVRRSLRLPDEYSADYLWMYLVFAYLFSALAAYLIVTETRKVIEVRQEYLGSQTTITDRTIRLSGVPPEYRSEEKIKEFIENLEIGQVETVLLCRNWKELDKLMAERMKVLRRLEEAWTVYLGHRRIERNLESLPISQPPPPEPLVDEEDGDEDTELLSDGPDRPRYVAPYARSRPTTRLWYGPFKLRYRNVDAIDYFEERLRRLDEQIRSLRKKEFEPTPLAFVTLGSVASCQMAVQAVLNPSPLQFLAKASPAPSDVVWPNTYLSRSSRMFRAWSITVLITVLTIFWTFLLVPIAGALNTCSIEKVFPQLAKALKQHPNVESLVNTQLPTIVLSLLNVLVPYFYDWLANQQGMISQGDVELSVISKNFFFTFFNFFIVFTVLGTASGFVDLWNKFGDKLKDTTGIANAIALSLQKLLNFYTNFIILQGVGLFPLRLMEFGAVAMYPISLIGAKTPRDYAELVQPPVFSYGFFLPQTILIFLICMVYSVLRSSWKVLLSGLWYFMVGHFVHKYQLLYAMDHRQHSTGRGWLMICDRVIVGIILFQITMASQLAFLKAYKRSALIAPLIAATVWFSYLYNKTYRPLMKHIALRSLKQAEHSNLGRSVQEELSDNPWADERQSRRRESQTVDEARESGLRFVNPSMVAPLEDVWIADKTARAQGDVIDSNGEGF